MKPRNERAASEERRKENGREGRFSGKRNERRRIDRRYRSVLMIGATFGKNAPPSHRIITIAPDRRPIFFGVQTARRSRFFLVGDRHFFYSRFKESLCRMIIVENESAFRKKRFQRRRHEGRGRGNVGLQCRVVYQRRVFQSLFRLISLSLCLFLKVLE